MQCVINAKIQFLVYKNTASSSFTSTRTLHEWAGTWNENLDNWVVNSLFPSSTPTASSLPPIQANLQCTRPYNAHTPTVSKCLVFLQHFLLYFSVSNFHISIWDGLSLNFAGLGMLMVIILSPRQRWGFRGCPHGATVLHVVVQYSTRFSVFAQLV